MSAPKYQNKSQKRLREEANQALGWDKLIAHGKLRILEIKRSIQFWEEQRDLGSPYPLEQAEAKAEEMLQELRP